jgi:glucose-fructose oxidoreductase
VEPDGREGLADVRIVRALYRSAERREVVKLEPFAVGRRPTSAQEIDRSAPWMRPSLIHAAGPSGH